MKETSEIIYIAFDPTSPKAMLKVISPAFSSPFYWAERVWNLKNLTFAFEIYFIKEFQIIKNEKSLCNSLSQILISEATKLISSLFLLHKFSCAILENEKCLHILFELYIFSRKYEQVKLIYFLVDEFTRAPYSRFCVKIPSHIRNVSYCNVHVRNN